jgi:PHD/YefM family antitoxin component YafN of YafNO toxin-antitoxin module
MHSAGYFMRMEAPLVVHLDDICSLSEFQRNAKEHIARLKKTGRPEVLTVNGAAAVVVQDAQSYQKLMDLVERAEAVEGIRRGLDQAKEGKAKPARKVLDAIRKKHDIPRS